MNWGHISKEISMGFSDRFNRLKKMDGPRALMPNDCENGSNMFRNKFGKETSLGDGESIFVELCPRDSRQCGMGAQVRSQGWQTSIINTVLWWMKP